MTLVFLLAAALASAPSPEVSLTPRSTTLRIAVAGDSGLGTEVLAKAIARVHSAAPLDAIVLTGDNFYPCGVESVDDPRWSLVRPLTTIGIPIFPVLGNHDSCGKAVPDAQIRATGVLPHWRFPARQYAVRTPMADFAFLDTTPHAHGQASSIGKMLRETFARSRKPWRIVVGHHPVISSGWHGYFPRSEVRRMRELVPVLRETAADVYLCGHDHHVEVIRGRMLHVISGAGSSPVPPIKLRATTVFPEEIRRERIGFAVVEITARTIRVRVYDSKGNPRTNWISGRVRHDARGHRPVLFDHLDEADEDVVGTHAGRAEPRHEVGVDRALGRVGPPLIEDDLHDHRVGGALHRIAPRE